MASAAFSFARSGLINLLSGIGEDQVDIIPEGFNNSIRWNAGHIFLSSDNFFSHISGYERRAPEQYKEFFMIGTGPRDWQSDAPAWQEIVDHLKQQTEVVEGLLKQDPSVVSPVEIRGVQFPTVADIVAFINFHEGMHMDVIKTYTRLIK